MYVVHQHPMFFNNRLRLSYCDLRHLRVSRFGSTKRTSTKEITLASSHSFKLMGFVSPRCVFISRGNGRPAFLNKGACGFVPNHDVELIDHTQQAGYPSTLAVRASEPPELGRLSGCNAHEVQ